MQKKEKKINIFFFTANRAEYGLIFPFIKKLKNKNLIFIDSFRIAFR